jgi:hypothetical protein
MAAAVICMMTAVNASLQAMRNEEDAARRQREETDRQMRERMLKEEAKKQQNRYR